MQQLEPVEVLLDQLEGTNSPQQMLEALSLLEKLIANIVANPTEPKYRTIKATNPAIQARLLSLKGVERLISMLGYELQQDTYVIPDRAIGTLLQNSSAINFRRRLLTAKVVSPQEYQKQMTIINNQRAMGRKLQRQSVQQEKLKKQAQNDKEERKHLKVDDTQSRQLQFGTKTNTWKDIGVDLAKKGG